MAGKGRGSCGEPGRGGHRGRLGHGPGHLPPPGAAGRQVAVLDIDGDAADEVAKEVQAEGGTAVGAVDVSDRAAIDAALDEVRTALGPIGIMVTSAGIEVRGLSRHRRRRLGPDDGGQPHRAPSTASRPRCPT